LILCQRDQKQNWASKTNLYGHEEGIKKRIVKQVKQFSYLESLISKDGFCDKEINSRIGLAEQIFVNTKKVLTGKMNLNVKK